MHEVWRGAEVGVTKFSLLTLRHSIINLEHHNLYKADDRYFEVFSDSFMHNLTPVVFPRGIRALFPR